MIKRFLEKFKIDASKETNSIIKEENLSNESYLIGIMFCCIESVFFILNLHEISFSDLLNQIEIDIIKLWECFNDFIRSDPMMPLPLKYHLLDLEIKIISLYIWRNGSSLFKALKENLALDQDFTSFANIKNENFEKENQNKINLILNNKKNNGTIQQKEKNDYDVQ